MCNHSLASRVSTFVLVTLLGFALMPQAGAQDSRTLDQLRTARKELAHRSRRVIFNNDGCDCLYFPKEMPVTIDNFLGRRTTDLIDSHVDTLAYCSISSGFGNFSTRLGHRYGVPVYPCLSDSRVKGETRFRRSSPASYRGRALNAWAAGADGIHLFNLFNPQSEVFRQVGDRELLRSMDKLYFVTVRDGNPNQFLADGQKHRTVPMLTPSYGKTIAAGSALNTTIAIGDDAGTPDPERAQRRFLLHLELPRLSSPEQVLVRFNEHLLMDGLLDKGWLDLPIASQYVQQGDNQIEIALNPSFQADEGSWSMAWEGSAEPASPWRRDQGSIRARAELVDGAMRIADSGVDSGDYLYWRVPWGASGDDEVVVEARVKVESGSSYVIFSNGASQDRLGLWPDHIDLWSNRGLRYDVNTTDAFHDYRIVFKGQDLQIYVDGELRIDGRGKFTRRETAGRNEVAFGAANSPMVGDAYWEYVRARLDSLGCSDIVVSDSLRIR